MLLNSLSWVFESRNDRRQLCFLAIYISSVAFVYEFLAWREHAPIFETATGRPNSLLRYIMWGHATPAMLYTLSLISDFDAHRLTRVILVDIFMIATAIPGELIPSWHRWIWNIASCAVFPFVFHEIWCMYTDAISAIAGHSEADKAARCSLSSLRLCTVTFWSVFPIVWACVQLGLVSIQTEEILWSVSDICGKIFFSSSLLHSNFMTIESRRLAAMRVIEESNRVKVIHELRQLVEQKEGFIALMSHELRTPLNGIIGLSNALLSDLPEEGDVAYTVATIRNSGARLLNLINDILDASALRKGRLVVAKNRVILQHAVDDVIELTTPLVHSGVHLSSRIGSDIPPVVGDASRLVQVLYNLIGNACKFTNRGEIWVDAEVNTADKLVEVTIHDTGIGIPKDKLVDIFSPFEQVDMSAARRYGGTGLGLNLAKQLIEAHGGTIFVSSVPGKGSKFTFTVPMWSESKGGSPNPPASPRSSKRRFMLRSSIERVSSSTAGIAKNLYDRLRMSEKAEGSKSESEDRGDERVVPPLGVEPALTALEQSSNYLAKDIQLIEEHDEHKVVENGASRAKSEDWSLAPAQDRTTPETIKGVEGGAKSSDDSQRDSMIHRLSLDAAIHFSMEYQRQLSRKAPQQLDAESAIDAFAHADAPEETFFTEAYDASALGNDAADRISPEGRQFENDQAANDGSVGTKANENAEIPSSAEKLEDLKDSRGTLKKSPSGPSSPIPSSLPVSKPFQDGNTSGDSFHPSWLAAAAAVEEAERCGDIRVLSVDDDPVNQMVIQTMLKRAGFKVSKASDGNKALEILEDALALGKAPDIMLLDVMMPGLSGYDVCRKIRKKYPWLMLPVILVSANGHEDQVVQGLHAGASDYITKPLRQRELVARIVTQLRNKAFSEARVQQLANVNS